MTHESSDGAISQECSKSTINNMAVEQHRKQTNDENYVGMYPSTMVASLPPGLASPASHNASSADYGLQLERKLAPIPSSNATAASIVAARSSSCLFSFLRSSPVVPIVFLPPPAITVNMANPQRPGHANGIAVSAHSSKLPRYRSAFDPFQRPARTSTKTTSLNTNTDTNAATTCNKAIVEHHQNDNANTSKGSTLILTTQSHHLEIPEMQPTMDTEKFTFSTLEDNSAMEEGLVECKIPYKTAGGGLKLQNDLSVLDIDDGTSQLSCVNESSSQYDNVVIQSDSTNITLDGLASATGISTTTCADSHTRNHSIMEQMDVNDNSSTTSMSITNAEDVPSLSNEDVEEEPSCGSSTRAGDAEVQETIEHDAMLRRRALMLQILNHGERDAVSTNSNGSSDTTGYVSPATIREGACMSLDRCFASSIAELLTGVEINITSTHPQQQQQLLRTVSNRLHPHQHHYPYHHQQQPVDNNQRTLGATNSPSSSSSPMTPPKKIISTAIIPDKLNLTEAKRPSARRLAPCSCDSGSTNESNIIARNHII